MTRRLEPAVVYGWMELYGPRLMAVARAFEDGAIDADDILQKTWVIAWQKGGGVDPAGPVGAWLHQIALNVGRSAVRKQRRRLELLKTTPLPVPSVRASRSIDEELDRRALWRAIAELPDLQRHVLLLRLVEDFSTADVAERLGRAEGTVKASLHRALGSLRKKLARPIEEVA